MLYFLKCHIFFTQLSPVSTRLDIITIINNCQSAASVQLMGCLISMAQHLFCGKADYFLQQARPITLVKWYHINQNLTRWQIWSYQIPRDTVTNMSLSQVLSAGMLLPYQIYHPTGSQRKLPYSEKWEYKTYGKWKWESSSRLALGSGEGAIVRKKLRFRDLQVILDRKTCRLFPGAQPSPFTLYIMIFIHHMMTVASNQQQTCKPSNLKYADTMCRHINTGTL